MIDALVKAGEKQADLIYLSDAALEAKYNALPAHQKPAGKHLRKGLPLGLREVQLWSLEWDAAGGEDLNDLAESHGVKSDDSKAATIDRLLKIKSEQ
jgi:hypothetical protein